MLYGVRVAIRAQAMVGKRVRTKEVLLIAATH